PTLSMAPYFGSGIGQPPVYMSASFDAPVAITHLGAANTYTVYGWRMYVIWAVVPGYTGQITLSGASARDGRPLWLTAGLRHTPTTSITLDPAVLNVPAQYAHWNEWFGALYLPGAGCYTLTARWASGMWQLPFAAGK
ncbi:MAG: hypothetical protein IVW57_19395, partial [Ktedonobacterales bacterium]|nr:hypothetical protein [Ktedonobacterales bacterium]